MKIQFFKTAAVLVSFLAVVSSCKKEEVPEEYKRSGNSLAVATNGHLVIAGYNSTSKGYDASLIVASESNGDTIWNRNFGGSYSDAFYCVKNSHEGGYIATGFSNKSVSGSPSMYVVITDANGKQVEALKYGGSLYSQGFGLIAQADSGYLVAGYIQSSSNADRDIYLVRINNSGDIIWESKIGANSTDPYDTVNDAAYSVMAAPDGGYFVTGSMNGYSSCCGKIFLMKVSSDGDSLWTRTYRTGIGYSLALTDDGGIAIGGTLQETNNQEITIIKTDTAGTLLWEKTYNGNGYEFGASMVKTSDGGFAITGITDSKGAGYHDIYLLCTNSSGDMLWDHTYGGNNIDQGYGLVQMSDGGFSMTGLTNTGGSFIYLNRTSQDGTQLWYKNIK